MQMEKVKSAKEFFIKDTSEKGLIFSRQNLMFDETVFFRRCVILWCWFIGSNLAFNLMKTGFTNFLLVDFDTIWMENMLNQMYLKEDIGKKKVEGLKNTLNRYSPQDLFIETSDNIKDIISWKIQLEEWDIICLAPDNATIRKEFLEWYSNKQKKWELTDTILTAIATGTEHMMVVMIQKYTKGVDKLKEHYSGNEEDYSVGVCWAKSAYFMWSLMSWLVISFLKNFFFPFPEDVIFKSRIFSNEESYLVPLKFN